MIPRRTLGRCVKVFWSLFMTLAGNAEPFGEAEWLRDPIFESHQVIDTYHKEQDPVPALSGPQNVHTYFRKEFDLEQQPISARLHFTADDYAKICLLYTSDAADE